MMLIAQILMVLIALLHVYFLVLEMFLWDKPLGMKVFGNNVEKAKITKVLAQNQGLYNGFLAAGLFWAVIEKSSISVNIATFFLTCIVVAGVYGAMTASTKIFFIQALPAIITLIVIYLFQ